MLSRNHSPVGITEAVCLPPAGPPGDSHDHVCRDTYPGAEEGPRTPPESVRLTSPDRLLGNNHLLGWEPVATLHQPVVQRHTHFEISVLARPIFHLFHVTQRGVPRMIDEKTVTVSLKDLCDIADAVDGMMHDLDNGQRDHLRLDIDRVHLIVERWAVDETVLAGGCHPDHRCRLCRDDPELAELRVRWNRQAEADSSARRDSEGEETPEMSGPLQLGRGMTYIYDDEEFILEHISPSVVRVSHGGDTGYFGLAADRDPTYPYTWTGHDVDIHPGGIAPGSPLFPLHTEGRVGRPVLCDAER